MKSRRVCDEIVRRLKASELYEDFKKILSQKIENERFARSILINNLGRLKKEDIERIFQLVDEPYPYHENGKLVRRPWFGRLIKPNALGVLVEADLHLNQWFNLVSNSVIPITRRMHLLRTEPYKLKGLNNGFITLIFYLLDKGHYMIWFQSLHEGLGLVCSDIEKYNGTPDQYKNYNRKAIEFARAYGFDHTELDWVFSTGIRRMLD